MKHIAPSISRLLDVRSSPSNNRNEGAELLSGGKGREKGIARSVKAD